MSVDGASTICPMEKLRRLQCRFVLFQYPIENCWNLPAFFSAAGDERSKLLLPPSLALVLLSISVEALFGKTATQYFYA